MSRRVQAPLRLRWASIVLGFGLGGFFDGILLHQVLQWHHLLSAIEEPSADNIRWHILFDGVFHAGMYLLTVIGLVMLWRYRGDLAAAGQGQIVLGGLALGFGTFHIFDGIAFHWLLGLHHIKMDQPLLWDLIFFAAGLVLATVGWRLMRMRPRSVEDASARRPGSGAGS